jgi:hypothetical protein
MHYTITLIITMAIAAAVCAAPVAEEKPVGPRTRVSANPDNLLAHKDSGGAGAVNKHFVLNNEQYNQFIKVLDNEEG